MTKLTFIFIDTSNQNIQLLQWKTDKRTVQLAWKDAEALLHKKMRLQEPDAFNRRYTMIYAFKGLIVDLDVSVPLRAPTRSEVKALAMEVME